MTEPTTEAGRDFVAAFAAHDRDIAPEIQRLVPVIEAEAVATERERIAAAVTDMEYIDDRGQWVRRAAVLRIVAGEPDMAGEDQMQPISGYDYETEGFGGT